MSRDVYIRFSLLGGKTMKNEKKDTTSKAEHQIKKRIGNTTYKVNIRFNPQSGESMSDKMKRVLLNQIRDGTGG